jgi:hypothetical protein
VLIEWVGLTPELERRRYALQVALASLIRGYLDDAAVGGRIAAVDTDLAAHAWLGAINEVVIRWIHAEDGARLQEAVPDLTALLLRSVGIDSDGAA